MAAEESTGTRRGEASGRGRRGQTRRRARRWAVTLNPRATDDERDAVDGGLADVEPPAPPAFDPICLYHAVWVKHRATLIHWHGFLHFKDQKHMPYVKMYVACNWAHCEIVRDEAGYEEYLRDGHDTIEGPLEYGHVVTQGYRSDWERVQGMALTGMTARDVLSDMPSKGINVNAVCRVVAMFRPRPPARRDVWVTYLYGASGVGKTHRARTKYPEAYVLQGKFNEGKSFDQYRGEKEIIFDEWRSYEWPLTVMDGLLDVWTNSLLCRYENKYSEWDTVVITTNERPDDCYRMDPARGTFIRRISLFLEVEDRDDVLVF